MLSGSSRRWGLYLGMGHGDGRDRIQSHSRAAQSSSPAHGGSCGRELVPVLPLSLHCAWIVTLTPANSTSVS